jgi:hypothetical protein
MSTRLLISLAILGIIGASSAAFAAPVPTSDFDSQHMRHKKPIAAQLQPQAPQFLRPEWNLPQGWPRV